MTVFESDRGGRGSERNMTNLPESSMQGRSGTDVVGGETLPQGSVICWGLGSSSTTIGACEVDA